ncbi:MAG TPA: bifunctional adenosylcobinamide kinase/adenosylcobinamide-phosphate guanylyltransferase [Dehalococcoidia bacterium]|nr:bifunctional adenosylcobinamide kinase/adenosylcobinamide-phosphate guanylyltransferase [Dehalococcoidia bacterium]
MATIWLITGGVRSGKSRLAVRLAAEFDSVTYVATAEAGDAEMTQRIAAHRAERPAGWRTIEEPQDLAGAINEAGAIGRPDDSCLIVDCLTLWTSNRLFPADWPDASGGDAATAQLTARQDETLRDAAKVVTNLQERPGTAVVVTNEVGSGVIPPDPRLRAWEDTLGAVNSLVAAAADRLYLCVAGQAIDMKALGARPVGEIDADS